MSTALLSFKLGPVQPFIEAARTIRDLWSGSYLLSWLAAHGIKALFDGGAPKQGVTFVTPDADLSTNPLLRAVILGEKNNSAATLACLPHTFAAQVPVAEARTMRKVVLNAVGREWEQVATKVKAALDPHFRKIDPDWDVNWQRQIGSYFELTCVTLPLSEADEATLEKHCVNPDQSQDPANALWGRQWNMQKSLLDTARMVRHVPAYSPNARDGKHPVKCSLLGSYEQMGPADIRKAQEFWERVSTPNWSGINGTRLQPNDRFCAVSLVKRFAWAVYWRDKLGLEPAKLRYSDTPTMAAKKWLGLRDDEKGIPAIDPLEVRHRRHVWNGNWLHLPKPDHDDVETCPGEVWKTILVKKRLQGTPPTYYALLHLDGDNMGDVFQGSIGAQFGYGIERFRAVTKYLTAFAQGDVERIVKACQGELIYAGGDDVLAFLPTETAVECAGQLRKAFETQLPNATLSGGIAVVHWKEDLRFALGQVRAAEKQAKRIGKKPGNAGTKDALAITVCKRSGEHTTTVMGWPEAAPLQHLIWQFQAGASDGWVYKLRDELETLKHLPIEAGRVETFRLVDRGEFADKASFRATVETLLDGYKTQMTSKNRNWPPSDVLVGFVTLVQAASFLARGKE